MSKHNTGTENNVIGITTTVSLNGKDIESRLKIKLSDIQKIIDTKGAQAANESIQQITKLYYDKVSDNIKEIINEPL